MKHCIVESCPYGVFGGGYCRYHQYLRRDLKKYHYKRQPTGELELFKKIWNERDHVSFISNKYLRDFDVRLFAHVLPKKKYEILRLQTANIVLLTPYEHDLFDKGTEQQREKYKKQVWDEGGICNWDKLYKLRDELLRAIKQYYGNSINHKI